MNEHTRRVAAVFDSVAPTYEGVGVAWFVPIAERLVDEIDIHPSWHVLDVGCGTGAALPSLSAAVGPSGRVVGIDISEGMLDRARETAARRGLRNVELYHLDATDPDLPKASFNAVVSSLVAFFLPDPEAALRRWHDLLLPMGHLGITTFGERPEEWRRVDDLFTPYLPPGLADARTTGERPPFATDDQVADLVASAGFENVRTVRFEQPISFRDTAHWRQWSMSVGQRAMWNAVPADERDQLEQRAGELLRNGDRSGAIHLSQVVRITTALRSY